MTNLNDNVTRTRAFFDEAAHRWGSRYERDAYIAGRRSRFLDAIKSRISGPADILDFGCGSGAISLFLNQQGHRVTGCDLSDGMIAEAKGADIENRVTWITLNDPQTGASLPFDKATFDVVVASSVFEYLPDVATTLREIARVLRPGGWLFATVPDVRSRQRRRERWLRWAIATPGLAQIIGHSRWSEGASYLRISVNRMPPEVWMQKLLDAGFNPDRQPQHVQPLLLLSACAS